MWVAFCKSISQLCDLVNIFHLQTYLVCTGHIPSNPRRTFVILAEHSESLPEGGFLLLPCEHLLCGRVKVLGICE